RAGGCRSAAGAATAAAPGTEAASSCCAAPEAMKEASTTSSAPEMTLAKVLAKAFGRFFFGRGPRPAAESDKARLLRWQRRDLPRLLRAVHPHQHLRQQRRVLLP